MFCKYCGMKLPDKALFCNKCGRRQDETSDKHVTETGTPPFLPKRPDAKLEISPTEQQELRHHQQMEMSHTSLNATSFISRRALIIGLTSGAAIVVTGSLTWLIFSQRRLEIVPSGSTGSASGLSTASALAQRSAQYSGIWINNDSNTRGITKLIISDVGQTLTVHGYGRCHPTDCNWNSRSGTFNGDPFVILFDFGNGLTDELTISLDNQGGTELKVVDAGSASGINTYYFYKQG